MTGTRGQDDARGEWPGNETAAHGRAAFASPIEKAAPVDRSPVVDGSPLVDHAPAVGRAPVIGHPAPGVGQPPLVGPVVEPWAPASGQRPQSPVIDATPWGPINARRYAEGQILDILDDRLPGPRQPVGDIRWAVALRRFGRPATWCLPLAVIALTLSTVWGWPTPTDEPSGASPGSWLLLTVFGFALWLLGLIALGALLAATPARPWSLGAVLCSLAGAMLLAPVLGVLGLARPAVSRAAPSVGPTVAHGLETQFFQGAVARWLVVGGLLLLAVGGIAAACTILASNFMNRLDGWLVLAGVGLSTAAAYLSWEFLLTVAGMAFLAATLGIAWTASRLTPDGLIADD